MRNETLYRILFQESKEATIVVAEDGTFIDVNQAFLDLLDYTKPELMERTAPDIWADPSDRQLWQAEMARQGSVVDYECRQLRKDGTIRDCTISSTQQQMEDGSIFYITVTHDVTERKRVEETIRSAYDKLEQTVQERTAELLNANRQLKKEIEDRTRAERALRESEERYKSVVDGNLSAIVLYRQEEILFANKPFFNIFGYDPGELENIVVDDLLAPEAAAEVAEKRRQRMAGEIEQVSVYESKGKRKNGERFDMEISVCATHYLGEPCCIASLSDISERKKSEEAIRESESRFRTLFDLNPQPVAVVEMRTGKLIDVNDKYCELMQYDKAELIGHSTIELGLISKADRDLYLEHMNATGEVTDLEIDFTIKDGSVIHLLVFSKHIRISGEDFTVTVLHDITERKWLESQLQQAHKMEAVGTLAGGIAHDFNNILGIIIGNAELAMEDIPEENPARQNLEEVYKACIRARDVVRQILTFSRQANPQLTPVKISPIIRESLKLVRSSIPSTIEIKHNIKNQLDTVNANPTQINQILLNLCANAAHAMEENGGIIEVDLENVTLHEGSPMPAPELHTGVYVKLSVKDTGHGIGPESLDRIFDPYFTTKEVGKGTGLGLAVAHAIAKSHGGAITASSKIDTGSKFHVFLPVADAEVVVNNETEVELPKGNERILLIDDEKEIVKTIHMLIARLGYSVTHSVNSLAALETFQKNPNAYDLVITDMTMPHMTGDRLAEEILGLRPDIPVILCTGFSDRIDNEMAKNIGIRELLYKPITMGELAKAIRKVLDAG